MLFRYESKIYIRPFGNKLVRVNITKKGDEYDVVPTKEMLVITREINEKLYSISLEEAYKMSSKVSLNMDNK
jgi:hypothetical protein